MKLIQISPPMNRHKSLSNSSRYLTPSRSGQKIIKGINLTIIKNQDKKLPLTIDRTMTPVSTSNSNAFHKFKLQQNLPAKQLFRKDSPFPKKYREIRNKSLPVFNFDYHSFSQLSGFKTVAQPYVRLFDQTTASKKNLNDFSNKYSPFTDTSTQKYFNGKQNALNLNSSVGQCLKFDTQSPQKKQIRIHTQPSLKASPVSSIKFTQTKMSQIYLDTPKRQITNQKQSSTLKSLKSRIMKTSLQELKTSMQGSILKSDFLSKENSQTKNGFQFSLNIDPLKQKVTQGLESNDLKSQKQKQTIQDRERKQRQKAKFFDLSPKVSQQFQTSIYELTDSDKKGSNFSPHWRLAESQSIDLSFIKPVKRKLTLQQKDQQTSDLKQSLILTQLLNSLKKNTIIQMKHKKPINFELIRKCSQSLCLVRNKQSGLICGLIRKNQKEAFVSAYSEAQSEKLCLQIYEDFQNFILTEAFEYTLEQIFQMKLIDQQDIPGVIKRFHPTLNKIKEISRGGRINLLKLKERIVFTHGSIKIIPLVQIL